MIALAFPLAPVIAVPLIALAVLYWRRGFLSLGPGRRAWLLGIRVALLASLVLALSGLLLRLPAQRQETIFVADLSASDQAQQGTMLRDINGAIKRSPPDALAGVVGDADGSVVEQAPQGRGRFTSFPMGVPAAGTNLQSGLLLASTMLSPTRQRRIVLLSDGRQTTGDALSMASTLRTEGIRLDVVPVSGQIPPDAAVLGLTVPPAARAGERFRVTAALWSNVAQRATVQMFRDGTLIRQHVLALRPGTTHWTVTQGPLPSHLAAYNVRIVPQHDAYTENDTASSVVRIAGPPNVLVIASRPGEAANVAASLRAAGDTVTVRLPSAVSALAPYAAVVVVDTDAPSLGFHRMQSLVGYVKSGGGLVVIGGQNSYGPGGYAGTPMETVLPVNMNVRHQEKVPPVAVVVLIESLEVFQDITISKQAAQGLVELLTPADEIAINDTPETMMGGWVVRMQHVTHKAAIESAVLKMDPGDPYTYMPFMQEGFQVLRHNPMHLKHMILVGDGDAPDNYRPLITRMRRSGIIFSTIGVNDALGLGDYSVLRRMARWGGGVYYRAYSSEDVPRLFLRELQTLRRSALIQAHFTPRVTASSPLLRGIPALPPLDGYVQTTARPTAEVVLEGKQRDPVLADWQVGLGRSVAWTSDAAGLWTAAWLHSPSASHLWQNLVAWVLPPVSSSLSTATSADSGQGTVAATIPAGFGLAPHVTAHVLDPRSQTHTVAMQPSSPNRYVGSFPAALPGIYRIALSLRGNGRARVVQTALAVPYPAEYRSFGTELPFLRQLAASGGGRVLSRPTWSDALPTVWDSRPLTPFLLLIALGLLLAELAVRFLVVGTQPAERPGRRSRPSILSPSLFSDDLRDEDRPA
ncbi:MAG TPA: glutamine amidotransferase [Chloroflexota bacterium]|nr:glutamine amidotransferase [Chloroflexota bacterium]